MKYPHLILAALLSTTTLVLADDNTVTIDRSKNADFSAPTPVSLTGFTGEADTVMRFDLFFMGFTFVGPDKANYVIQGKNGPSRVEAIVLDAAKAPKLAKAYTGANIRSSTHALADDIAVALGRVAIAQTKIAFVAQPAGVGPGEVVVSDFDGQNPLPVTQDGVIVAAPAWSGRSKLFYTSYKFGRPEIFSQSLTTGARKAIVNYNGLNTSVAVSPDGRRLAMILSKNGSPDLYISDLEGGGLKQLTSGRGVVASPTWSPDSRTLCYSSDRSGIAGLYTITIDGGTAQRLPTTGVGRPTEPDWSPDGKYIVFTSQARDFSICYVSTTGPRRGQAVVLAPGEDPVWAPNSRAVIFSRNVNNRHVLSLLDVPSKQYKDIARISGSAAQPSWAR